MTDFIQLHILTSYPPSNLNRDDLGRPKTAIMGGTQRLRISSQSLKRAWRTSEIFHKCIDDSIESIRTTKIGTFIYKSLISGNQLIDRISDQESENKNKKIDETTADRITSNLLLLFGNQKDTKKKDTKKKTTKEELSDEKEELSDEKEEELSDDISKKYETEQICVLNKDEIVRLNECIHRISENDEEIVGILSKEYKNEEKKKFKKNFQEKYETLSNAKTAIDVAMFGRMLTSNPSYNVEAAVQVSHAISVHKVAVEDDFFTAVDDLNNGEEDMGSAHLGETEFASGLFYIYACINRDLLKENLSRDEELTKKALQTLTESALTVSPSGKQNSFASRAYASYVLAEKGRQQPRSLSVAFLKALEEKDLLGSAIKELNNTREKIENVYGKCCENKTEMNAYTGEGSIQGVLKFVAE
ncbi:MAG: type I-E CRISPR-associated protein Cas7/Cse4/CasC [Methanosarcina sp.]